MSLRWDNHFLDLALAHARMSKDPSTRVGAVAVRDRVPVMQGFNGFPMGIWDDPARLADRERKLEIIVHAEQNVIALAARHGVRLEGCTLYLAATDDSGAVWGGPPCVACTIHVIQAGFTRVVSRQQKAGPSKWHGNLNRARGLLCEAEIPLHEVPLA